MNKINEIKQPNKEFWRSIHEFKNWTREFDPLAGEFPDSVKAEFDVDELPPISRRKFMALLSASSAFAVASCTDYRDKGEIISYNHKPEYANFGDSVYYASSLNDGLGVLVKTREGRPVKIDGNPDHPVFKGKITTAAQAALMDIYNPDRVRNPLKNAGSDLALFKNETNKVDWLTADKEIVQKLKSASEQGKEIAIVTHSVISPTQKRIFDDFKSKYPTTNIYSYELHHDLNRSKAFKECYSSDKIPSIKWEDANIILTLEADILGNEGNVVETTRKFANRRNIDNLENFNRLYAIEAVMSQTGINADYRFRLTPEKQSEFVLVLIDEISKRMTLTVNNIPNSLTKTDLKSFAIQNGLDVKKIYYLVDDLVNNSGKAMVYAGEKLPVDVHKLVLWLNDILDNKKLYNFKAAENRQMPLTGLHDLKNNLINNKIAVLINFDSNPLYHYDIDTDTAAKAATRISLVEMINESCASNNFILPINHPMESWNDFMIRDGVISLQQPVISPLYDSRQKEAVLLNWIFDKPESYSENIYHQYLKKRWEKELFTTIDSPGKFNKFWYSSLHDGVINIPIEHSFEHLSFSAPTMPIIKNKKDFTVILTRNYSIGDGRYANNGWLQELPHPVSKVTWDNYAAIAPASAKQLEVKNDDVIIIEINGSKVEAPIIIQPGMAERVIAVDLGYGRTLAGEVGSNVGFNATPFMIAQGISEWIFTGAKVIPTGKTYKVFSTQEHHPLDEDFVKDFHFERDIIKEGTVEHYKRDKKFLKHNEHIIKGLDGSWEYTDVKWAMAIDLNKCTSCNACVIACSVENNIPVVGKEQVGKGREMQWMRIDRYYSGTPEDPKISLQPMLCQHCDNAPCENVCPVAATNHSPDGLNQMTYNRCVGTRYCANNCPFKVRRFNFFNFRSEFADGFYQKDSVELAHNPEVTVRSRGVMEKCTFCIQRIMEARQDAVIEKRELKGEDVKTACQVACPAEAIKFGDMNDPKSDVSRAREHDLAYHVLEILNVKPNVTYMAKLRNTHKEEV